MEKALIRFCTFMFLVGAGALATHYVVDRFVKPVIAAPEATEISNAWKLRVVVKDASGEILDVLVRFDPATGLPQIWKTQGECEAFMQSDEFNTDMPKLYTALKMQYPVDLSLSFACAPSTTST